MRKKLLAVLLSAAMVVTSLTACGKTEGPKATKDDGSYFKEMQKMTDVSTGTATTEVEFTGKLDEKMDETLLDADGNMSISVKLETVEESVTKNASVISMKYGKEETYSELTTIVLDEDMLYMNVKPIVDLIGKIDEKTATSVSSYLSTMGIEGYVSVKMSAVTELLQSMTNEEMSVNVTDTQDAAKTFVKELCDVLSKDFAKLAGKKDGKYTLTVNKDNLDDAKSGLKKLVNDDAETLYDAFVKYAKVLYGEESDTVKELVDSKEDNLKEMKDELKKLGEEEDHQSDSDGEDWKDADFDIFSSIKVDGKKGNRSSAFEFDAKVSSKEEHFTMKMSQDFKEGEVSIADKIPADAADITVLLKTMLQGMSQGVNENYDTDMNEDFSLDEM